MNELIYPNAILKVSLSEVSMQWLLVVAAGVLIFSLFEAWLATLIIYGKITWLKKIFPATQNLIRSHVDYIMMTSLLGITYFICLHLNIVLPSSIIILLCIGSIYNPLGFFVKAINPKAGQSNNIMGRVMVCVAFLPTTIGFAYAMFKVIDVLI